MTVRYIAGHNPDLVIDGVERVDLTRHKTAAQLHEFFASRGFRTAAHVAAAHSKKAAAPRPLPCDEFASRGLCASNAWIREHCAEACSKQEL